MNIGLENLLSFIKQSNHLRGERRRIFGLSCLPQLRCGPRGVEDAHKVLIEYIPRRFPRGLIGSLPLDKKMSSTLP